ncbi:gp246 [Sphingomonas phage PAU]|uniref:ribonucleotide reductase large subunit n=1 Tax=Sphingomonas phage PAU TaxID=1150991 RepID=UPI00025733FC|nr:ribonucleotide reductase large subunit [Sphingomonas phage PAU]AFF28244.1 gp246 [Sphingomonas phage PAU]
MNNPWILLNNQLLNRAEGTIDLEKDKEAARQFFLGYVNKNMVWFHSLHEKLCHLVNEGYYFDMFQNYEYEEIKEVFSFVYSKKFRFQSYMAAFLFYKNYAMRDGETDQFFERYEDRIATVALYTSIDLKTGKGDLQKALAQAEIMINQEYQPATPTFSNAGKLKGGELVSCFLDEIGDSKVGISKSIQAALDLSSMGGGVSFNVSKLRARGEAIKGIDGRASGVLPVMKILEDAFSYANQLGQRPGAGAAYINIFHSDVEEFLDSKKINADEKSRLKSLSLGVIVPDKFMELAEKDEPFYVFYPYTVKKEYGKHLDDLDIDTMYSELVSNPNVKKRKLNARRMLTKIAQVQKESGYPYFFLKTNANEYHPLKNLGDVKFSNLCFTGDTLVNIITRDGQYVKRTIEDLSTNFDHEKEGCITVQGAYWSDDKGQWDYEWFYATAFQTGWKKVIKLELSNGGNIKCTPNHEIATIHGKYVKASESIGSILASDSNNVYVTDIKELNECVPVYDLNVQGPHNFTISVSDNESVLVHNCTEIMQYSEVSEYNDYDKQHNDKINYGISCNLGSLNIATVMKNSKDTNRFERIISTAMDSLTHVTDRTNIAAVPAIARANKHFRSVGLGAMNLHGYLAQNEIMFESDEALDFVNVFFGMVNYYSLKRSMEISRERDCDTFEGFDESEYGNGKYFDRYIDNFNLEPKFDKTSELFEGIEIPSLQDWVDLKDDVMNYGIYHAYRLAIAPNQSTAYIMSATPSIMPISDQVEVREYDHSTTFYPMPGMNDDNMFFYKSAYDMDQFKVLRLVSVIQRHIDQGISCILHTNSEDDTALMARYYIYAWKMKLKSLYYTRTRKSSIDGCISCSA